MSNKKKSASTTTVLTPEVNNALKVLRAAGAAVVVFTPEELAGANPKDVQDGLVQHGWGIIEFLKG
jgi:hypothetical protein